VVQVKIHLPAPARDFGSDNRSGVSPSVLAALAAANIAARSESYGLDRESMGTTAAMCELFDQEVHAVLVPSGTAANVAAIGALLDGPGGCVLAAEDAHIRLDESGAIERAWGVPLVPVAVSAGLLPLDKISSSIARLRNNAPFSPKPMVLSLTELSETGRRYGAGLLAELCEIAHFYDIKVHVDGARFANALVEDPQLSSLFDLGVSTLAFGGTKNGQLPVEAIVSVDAQVHDRVYRAAKQLGYVQSKSRFVAAGLGESIRSGEFLANAAKANECAQRLSGLLTAGGLAPEYPVDGNLVFVRVPAHLIEGIDAWCHVSRWDESGLIRLACSWDHTFEDVDRLAAGLLLAFQSSESA
jgi:threonine aldolase